MNFHLTLLCGLVLLHGTHGSVPVDQNGDNMVSPGEFDEAFAANEDDVTPSGAVSTHGGFAVQIVKPDGKGGIEVVPEGLEILKSLGTLHVVSVRPPTHNDITKQKPTGFNVR